MISSSDAPIAARPISWENWAKFGSANNGIWPSNSWQQSLEIIIYSWVIFFLTLKLKSYGSGVYDGFDECLIYCVQWKTRNAKPYRKSLGDK